MSRVLVALTALCTVGLLVVLCGCGDSNLGVYTRGKGGGGGGKPGGGDPPPSTPSKIAFGRSLKRGIDQIFTMNTDGSGVTQLTDSSGDDYDPSWSPAGDRIVFVTDRDGPNRLYTMNADGSNEQPLTGAPGPSGIGDEWPDWGGPNGDTVVFTREADIWTVDVDTGVTTQLTHDRGATIEFRPTWSRHGNLIAFDSGGVLYAMNADGSDVRELATYAGMAAWSPVDDRIAYGHLGDIWVIDADGSNAEMLLDVPTGWGPTSPSWSPEADKIVFQADPTGSAYADKEEIYTAVIGTGELTRLTDNRSYDGAPDWSPAVFVP